MLYRERFIILMTNIFMSTKNFNLYHIKGFQFIYLVARSMSCKQSMHSTWLHIKNIQWQYSLLMMSKSFEKKIIKWLIQLNTTMLFFNSIII